MHFTEVQTNERAVRADRHVQLSCRDCM